MDISNFTYRDVDFVFPPTRTSTNAVLCPDLLDHTQIGVADNWRGRVVRAFFWAMRAWPAK